MKSQQSILAILCISLFYSIHYGQTKPTEEIPYIEVNGYAEKEIIPNEIYIGITLRERMENKEKVTIEAQEKLLLAGGFFHIRVLQKDLISSRTDRNAFIISSSVPLAFAGSGKL